MKKTTLCRRTATSPWVVMPTTTQAGYERFLLLGTYHSIQTIEE